VPTVSICQLRERSEKRIETRIEICFEIMRLLNPNGNPIDAPERISELSEIQSHETQRTLTIEGSKEKAFLPACGARAHENSLGPATLVQPKKWTPIELLSQFFARCIDCSR